MKKNQDNRDKTIKIANLRIRTENLHKKQKRLENAALANKMRQAQIGEQLRLDIQRADAVLHKHPPNHQRTAILQTRGELQKKFDNLKIA